MCFCAKRNIDVALLLIRIGLAGVFIFHGMTKFLALSMISGFFLSLGLPSFMVYLIPTLEVLAGILVLLGLYVETSAIILSLIMIFAIILVKFKAGFANGWEYEAFLLMVSFSLAFSGPGKYSLSPCCNKSNWLQRIMTKVKFINCLKK